MQFQQVLKSQKTQPNLSPRKSPQHQKPPHSQETPQLCQSRENLQPRHTRESRARRGLRLVTFESSITAGSIAMSIMTPFFYSVGLSNVEISLSQAIFTIVVSLLNLPMGWLADRFSRKWLNVIGDFGCALGHLLYSTVHGFLGVVFCECWLGIFLSLSQGVDYALIKHFSNQITPEPSEFRRHSARLAFWQQCCTLFLVLLGGPLGAIDFRLAIAATGLPYFLGGLVGCFITDDSVRLESRSHNPLQDLFRIVKIAFRQPRLRSRLLVYAVGREMTHGIIWFLTPMLMLAGVPLPIVSLAWALDSIARILGTRLALRFAPRLSARQIFLVPLLLMTLSTSVLSLCLNLFTISFYGLMGIICGWTGATLLPLVQEETDPAEQTTIISLAKVLGQFLYIPASLLIGWAADFEIRYSALSTLLIFLPLGLFALHQLSRE